jgi:hypothetical protein
MTARSEDRWPDASQVPDDAPGQVLPAAGCPWHKPLSRLGVPGAGRKEPLQP